MVPPRPQMLLAGEEPFKRVLCAVDFSTASLKGLEFALSLAKEADARLSIVHVLDWSGDDPSAAGACGSGGEPAGWVGSSSRPWPRPS